MQNRCWLGNLQFTIKSLIVSKFKPGLLPVNRNGSSEELALLLETYNFKTVIERVQYFKALLINVLKCNVEVNYLASLFEVKERAMSSILDFKVEVHLIRNITYSRYVLV